jgi:hypothetical protein
MKKKIEKTRREKNIDGGGGRDSDPDSAIYLKADPAISLDTDTSPDPAIQKKQF